MACAVEALAGGGESENMTFMVGRALSKFVTCERNRELLGVVWMKVG